MAHIGLKTQYLQHNIYKISKLSKHQIKNVRLSLFLKGHVINQLAAVQHSKQQSQNDNMNVGKTSFIKWGATYRDDRRTDWPQPATRCTVDHMHASLNSQLFTSVLHGVHDGKQLQLDAPYWREWKEKDDMIAPWVSLWDEVTKLGQSQNYQSNGTPGEYRLYGGNEERDIERAATC